jgi:hypothetical protein
MAVWGFLISTKDGLEFFRSALHRMHHRVPFLMDFPPSFIYA